MSNLEASVGSGVNGHQLSKHLLDDQISVLIRDVARRRVAEERVRRVNAYAKPSHRNRQLGQPARVTIALFSIALFLGLSGWNVFSGFRVQRAVPQAVSADEELQEIAELQAVVIASAVDDFGEAPEELTAHVMLEDGLFTYTPTDDGRFRLRATEGDRSVTVDSEELGGQSPSRRDHE